MVYLKIDIKNFNSISFSIQLVLLISYFFLNIKNVGGAGEGIGLLILYISISIVSFFYMLYKYKIFLKKWVFLLALLILWLGIKVVFDLGDLEYLRSVTVSTTGGILLFFFLGSSLSLGFQSLFVNYDLESSGPSKNVQIIYFSIILIFLLCITTFLSFVPRLREDIFFIIGVNGYYQHPGNFISIVALILSYLFFSLAILQNREKLMIRRKLTLYLLYSITSFFLMVSAQMFGSNSGTAIAAMSYLLTLIVLMAVLKIDNVNVNLKAKVFIRRVFSYGAFVIISSFGLGLAFLFASGFDIKKTNLLGFGSGTNSSLISRWDILHENLLLQASNTPFLGNMNVAFETTGYEGRYIHSFLIYIFTHLGSIGLLITIALFFLIFFSLYRETFSPQRLQSTRAILGIFILLDLFIFANMTVTISWIVIWFAIGLFASPLVLHFPQRIESEVMGI